MIKRERERKRTGPFGTEHMSYRRVAALLDGISGEENIHTYIARCVSCIEAIEWTALSDRVTRLGRERESQRRTQTRTAFVISFTVVLYKSSKKKSRSTGSARKGQEEQEHSSRIQEDRK